MTPQLSPYFNQSLRSAAFFVQKETNKGFEPSRLSWVKGCTPSGDWDQQHQKSTLVEHIGRNSISKDGTMCISINAVKLAQLWQEWNQWQQCQLIIVTLSIYVFEFETEGVLDPTLRESGASGENKASRPKTQGPTVTRPSVHFRCQVLLIKHCLELIGKKKNSGASGHHYPSKISWALMGFPFQSTNRIRVKALRTIIAPPCKKQTITCQS